MNDFLQSAFEITEYHNFRLNVLPDNSKQFTFGEILAIGTNSLFVDLMIAAKVII